MIGGLALKELIGSAVPEMRFSVIVDWLYAPDSH